MFSSSPVQNLNTNAVHRKSKTSKQRTSKKNFVGEVDLTGGLRQKEADFKTWGFASKSPENSSIRQRDDVFPGDQIANLAAAVMSTSVGIRGIWPIHLPQNSFVIWSQPRGRHSQIFPLGLVSSSARISTFSIGLGKKISCNQSMTSETWLGRQCWTSLWRGPCLGKLVDIPKPVISTITPVHLSVGVFVHAHVKVLFN